MSDQEYITVKEALAAILAAVPVLPTEHVSLLDALGRVLAEPVVARDSLPPFANSSMDGYALRAADTADAATESPAELRVTADIAAGSVSAVPLRPGEAARIMTGAPLPPGADAVIPVEDTNEPWRDRERSLPDQIQIYRAVQPNDYVRHIGEDIEAGQVVLQAGHALRPQEVGILAALGVSQVPVYQRPKVGVLATGDELIPVEAALRPGKIRDSNGYAQVAQVLALGGVPGFPGHRPRHKSGRTGAAANRFRNRR